MKYDLYGGKCAAKTLPEGENYVVLGMSERSMHRMKIFWHEFSNPHVILEYQCDENLRLTS